MHTYEYTHTHIYAYVHTAVQKAKEEMELTRVDRMISLLRQIEDGLPLLPLLLLLLACMLFVLYRKSSKPKGRERERDH